MEHRSLAGGETGQTVRDVTLATYLGLVEPINGVVVSKPCGFTLVRGPGPFSFCNFAAVFDTDDTESAVSTLIEQAGDCPGFYVFVMSGDRPADLEEKLIASGFGLRQELTSMVWEPVKCEAGVGLDLVTDPHERSLVTGFMAEQFFWRLPTDARSAIATATAASRHQILKIGGAKEPQAAVMLVPVAGSIGLYNLCVRPELRSRGTGKSIVESIKSSAALSGTKVVLQCEGTLAPWYESLGFETVGWVRAYTFSGTIPGDILTK